MDGQKSANAGLDVRGRNNPRDAGREMDTHVRWGDRYPGIDYESEEPAVGATHF